MNDILQYKALSNKIDEVLWKVEGSIRAFTLRNKYGCDQCYAYYISEVPFGEEEEDE